MEAQVSKPWGEYVNHLRTLDMVIKTITVHPRERLSLQRHHWRGEHWYVVSGSGLAMLGIDSETSVRLSLGDSVNVAQKQWHRLVNDGDVNLVVVEVQTGHCDEDDIDRIEDDYGRASHAV